MFFSLSSLAINAACCIVTVYLAMHQHANHSRRTNPSEAKVGKFDNVSY